MSMARLLRDQASEMRRAISLLRSTAGSLKGLTRAI
jgi:signal transduction histidine kinase